jgi:FtsP/CotA-like multicopper oxidase with cupredoxin domain
MFKFLFHLLGLISIFALTACSEEKSTTLLLKNYTINVNGKSAEVYRIEQPDGTWGYRGIQGQDFNVIVENNINEPTAIHWHGLVLPNNQDGVPFVTQEPINPKQKYKYNFKLKQKGTYWMHSHYMFQAQKGLSAPLIIDDHKNKNDYQEVIMFITDFSFKEPEELWKELRKGMTHSTHNMNNMDEMNMSNMKMNMSDMNHGEMKNMDMLTPDLNDVKYDAYLVNYKAANNPDIIKINPSKKTLLRIINAASASNFIINLGELKGDAIAVDGEEIIPFSSSKFELAMAQRIDILLNISANDAAYPILAQGEGTKMQAGIILKTDNSKDISLSEKAKEIAPALDYNQELILQAKNPLNPKKIDRSLTVNLEGNMQDYIWKLNGEEWPNVTALQVKEGERVEIIFNNKSMMSHPMHLHGHVFQVTEIDGKKINGAMRDTVNILPNSTVKMEFDANNPGVWMLHCHVLYHEMGGMMTTLNYEGFKVPKFRH